MSRSPHLFERKAQEPTPTESYQIRFLFAIVRLITADQEIILIASLMPISAAEFGEGPAS